MLQSYVCEGHYSPCEWQFLGFTVYSQYTAWEAVYRWLWKEWTTLADAYSSNESYTTRKINWCPVVSTAISEP